MADLRDVTSSALDRMQEFKLIGKLLIEFLKDPIAEIKKNLDWSWLKTVIVYATLSIAAGLLNGIISTNIYNLFFGLIFMPIITFVTSHVLSGFFYYYFQIFERRQVHFLGIFHMVILANVPFLIIHTISSLLQPLTLLGLASSAFLLIVGLTDKFNVIKKRAIQIVSALYFLIFAVWLWEKVIVNHLD
jgi:hypothetical protein